MVSTTTTLKTYQRELPVKTDSVLLNVNTPADYEEALRRANNRGTRRDKELKRGHPGRAPASATPLPTPVEGCTRR